VPCWGDDVGLTVVRFTLAPGEDKVVTIEPPHARARTVRLRIPPRNPELSLEINAVWRAAKDQEVWSERIEQRDARSVELRRHFVPGTYRLAVQTGEGLRGDATIEVRDEDVAVPLEVTLR
jgi:hypothetical protein